MDTNDLLRRLRYAVRSDDAETVRLIVLGGGTAEIKQAARWRAKPDDDHFLQCSADDINHFLAGYIVHKRGPKDTADENPSTPAAKGHAGNKLVDNNFVLKQLRIALSLRSDDVKAMLDAGGCKLSASEVSALFRKPDARNYRQCGDQVLRQFINGLSKQRESGAAAKPEKPNPWNQQRRNTSAEPKKPQVNKKKIQGNMKNNKKKQTKKKG